MRPKCSSLHCLWNDDGDDVTWLQMFSFGAVCADSFDDIVDLAGNKTFRQIYVRDQILVQAIGLPAFLTIEMAVFFFFAAVSVIVTETVFQRAASVVYTVNEPVIVEESQCTEKA